MLDKDLAALYMVPTKVLNQSVKRNIRRFPQDFMFRLSQSEATALLSHYADTGSRSQFVTLKRGQNIKYLPYVFTEQGIAMLSGVLNSNRAIEVNIAIMRAFVRLRQILSTHKDLAHKLKQLERKVGVLDGEVKLIFDAIKKLMEEPVKSSKKIGFRSD